MRRLAAVALVLAGLALPAAAQDPSGPWRTLHTEHFRIHFRAPDRALATRAAAEAERAYRLLSSELKAPRGTVDLVLAGNVDAANGFAAVFPSNRVVLFTTPPVLEPGLEAHDDWLRLVTVHEVAHVFHLERSDRFWRVLQRVFGRAPGLFPNLYQPSWVTEGLATYYESRFSTAGRLAGSFHTQVLRADAGAGRFRRPWDAVLFTRWPDGTMPYAYGSRFFAHLSDARGDTVIPAFARATSGQLIPWRVGRQVSRVTGRPLVDQWREAAPAADARRSSQSVRVLARGLYQTPRPVLSPDGRRLAYLDDDWRAIRRIVVIDLASGERRAHRVTSQVSFGWMGDTLLVSQLDFTSPYDLRGDLYRWTWDGPWERLTRKSRVVTVGTGGALVVTEGGGSRLALWRNGQVTELATAPAGEDWARPVVSPDGGWIAAGRVRNGRWEVVRLGITGVEVEALGRGGSFAGDAAFAPNGSLFFVSDQTGVPQVYRAGLAGDSSTLVDRVSDAPLGVREPAPRGPDTYYGATLTDEGWQLVEVTGGDATRSPAAPPPDARPFEAATPVPTRETGYAFWPSLRPHYWIPAWASGEAGTFIGALTSGADAVGRWTYSVVITHAPDTHRWIGAGQLIYAGLGTPELDVAGSQDWSATRRPGLVVRVRERDAALGVTWVRRGWHHVGRARVAAEYEQDAITIVDSIGALSRVFEYANAALVLSAGRFLTPPLAISQENGGDVTLLLRRRERLGTSGWSEEARARVAGYLALPLESGFAHPVLAIRASGAMSRGPDARFFGAGGLSTTPLAIAPGTVLGERRNYPVRGYEEDAVLGTRVVSSSVELRVPLALVGRGVGHLPFGIDKLHATAFVDAGGAWLAGQQPTPAELTSVGAELVADCRVTYDVPTRLGIGLAKPAGQAAVLYLTFGGAF